MAKGIDIVPKLCNGQQFSTSCIVEFEVEVVCLLLTQSDDPITTHSEIHL